MEIHLNPRLTQEHQAAILKYSRNPRALSKGEWITALAAFDILSSCRVAREGESQTFAQFYEDFVDRPYATAFITDGKKRFMPYRSEVKAMSEQKENFGDLTGEEFDEVIAAFGSPGFHDLAPDVFFTALAAIDKEPARETLELTATIIDGQLNFLEPAPLYARGNEIQLGDKRLVIKLVPQEVNAAA
jgi:hypothetical protein